MALDEDQQMHTPGRTIPVDPERVYDVLNVRLGRCGEPLSICVSVARGSDVSYGQPVEKGKGCTVQLA